MNLEDPLNAETFIHINDEIPVEELTDDQIIEAVIEEAVTESNSSEEEEEEKPVISNRDAFDSIEKIIQYCKNPPDNFNVKMEELQAFNSVKEEINRLIWESTLYNYNNV